MIEQLKELYGDGRKMVLGKCWLCYFPRGFYFERGWVRYDGGCWCHSLATMASSEQALKDLIEARPLRARAWIKHREKELKRIELMKAQAKRLRLAMAVFKKRSKAAKLLPFEGVYPHEMTPPHETIH